MWFQVVLPVVQSLGFRSSDTWTGCFWQHQCEALLLATQNHSSDAVEFGCRLPVSQQPTSLRDFHSKLYCEMTVPCNQCLL
jgi:hypothetical protein